MLLLEEEESTREKKAFNYALHTAVNSSGNDLTPRRSVGLSQLEFQVGDDVS